MLNWGIKSYVRVLLFIELALAVNLRYRFPPTRYRPAPDSPPRIPGPPNLKAIPFLRPIFRQFVRLDSAVYLIFDAAYAQIA